MANYQELRARTLDSAQEEEAVTVNTRALIDKVLARYSSENTTLRELIQNAADANANSVEIRYETVGPSLDYGENEDLQRLVRSKVGRLLVKNDGQAFREEDWQRLKRIAEGNPDEQKIGAFGVGFYSVFADTEEPFISSGNQTMAFYWKGNSLFTRRATMEKVDPCTTFLLEYREPGELPDLKVLCQFFATSLTFVNLNCISLYINDIRMLSLNKKVSPSMPLEIPPTIIPRSSEGLMKIVGVENSRVQLDAKYMNITHYKPSNPVVENAVSGFARLLFGRSAAPPSLSPSSSKITTANLREYTTASIFLRISTATVVTSVNARFAQELERATKKPPPRRTTISCLTMSKDEREASEHESEIFENVIPSKSGRIFIGFPTHQTTSINAHIAAHSVIPTVERENIDLNARIVKLWNAEMLRASGILARILYCDEMDLLSKRAKSMKPSGLENLYDEAIHIMRQFTFHDSTPSTQVGAYIAEAFWSCTRYTNISIMSTKGVMPSSKVRLATDVEFLEGLPLLPEKITSGAKKFVATLMQGGFISEITITDIQNSLGEKPLSGEKAHSFLKWLSLQIQTGKLDDLQAPMLLSGAIAMAPTKDDNGNVLEDAVPVSLGTIRYHVNVSKLAADIPLPPECLPFALTKRLSPMDFGALKWKELEVTEWVKYVANHRSSLPIEQNIDSSPTFANQVLGVVSKNWDRLSSEEKGFLVDILKARTCIPTKQGMKYPKEAYFPTVKLFEDLPIIYGVKNVKDKPLAALGVRKTVELSLVFERLMGGTAGGEKWSHVDLIKYLTSVREDIPSEDIKKLRNMNMCKAEPSTSTKMYKVSELYEPINSLKDLSLPMLSWPGEWRGQSHEAKFLQKLGLRNCPPEEELMRLAAGADKGLREKALRYFIDQFHINSYSTTLVSGSNVAFLPLQNDKERLARPFGCFSNSQSLVMGFDVIRNDLQPHATKFGVKQDPDIRECAKRLKKHPPSGHREAKGKFGYFADRLGQLPMDISKELGNSLIVPVKNASAAVRYLTPQVCYVGDRTHKYGEIFDFVDFGTAPNAFLTKCGSKPEPTTTEIAYRMAKEPERLYQVFKSESKYLSMLRTIAEDWSVLKRDKTLVMAVRSSPCLGAYRDIPLNPRSTPSRPLPSYREMDEEEESIREFVLAKPEDISVIDDIANYNFFKADLLAAPEEDTLEKLYTALGSSVLSGSIEKQAQVGAGLPRSQPVVELHKLVLERARLFMHSNNETVAHDAQWLEKNLGLEPVKYIKHKLIFKPKGINKSSYTLDKTAAVIQAGRSSPMPYILYVTPQWEFYDIAAGLVKLILQRPKPHSSLLLESLLSTDLMTLKHRGYNVGRILAKKQAESRLMERERLQKVEEQRKALEEQEARYREVQQQQQQRLNEDKAPMPGAFADSPDRPQNRPPPADSGGILSRGFSRLSKLIQEPDRSLNKSPEQRSSEGASTTSIHEKDPRHVALKPTEPHRIAANLQRAVQSGRDHSSNSIFSPPKTFDVKEQTTFCDTHQGQNISYLAQTPTGMRVYVSKDFPEAERKGFLDKNAVALGTFSLLLHSVAEVFQLAPSVLHIHYDPNSRTIAFNTGGAIFCNFTFFLQLHAQHVQAKRWSRDAFKYWWVTICHELAHNLVQEHGSNHSFWTESFIQEYFGGAMKKVLELPE